MVPPSTSLRLTADQLCSDYPFVASETLLIEGKNWLRRLRDRHLILAQHRDVLVLARWLALLIVIQCPDRRRLSLLRTGPARPLTQMLQTVTCVTFVPRRSARRKNRRSTDPH
jgi:hypothetical protein